MAAVATLSKAARLMLAAAAVASFACRERLAFEVPPVPPLAEPALPQAAGVFAPAHTSIEGAVTGSAIADIDACAGCHADVFAQQQASAHAYSSFNNPVYRYSVEALRDAVGTTASRMCAGCHDVALLVDGAMDGPVAADDPRSHAGVTCRVCHGMSAARVDGNGSFTLSAEKIVLPRAGDSESVARHKESAAPIRGVAMCGSCHRGFLSNATGNGHFLPGMDELSAHTQSAYGGGGLSRVDDVAARSCVDCHMPKIEATRGDSAAKGGMISSHRFAGGHTWLAAMLGDGEQLDAQTEQLRGAATVDIAAAKVGATWSYPADDVVVVPGQDLEFDVVIRNRLVGHRFPAGVLDAQDTFVALEVRDSGGRRLVASGVAHRDGHAEDAHILRALVADQDGTPRYARDVQNFAAVVVNHTVAPRDAAAIRYRFEVPNDARLPLTLAATLVHRSRNRTVAELACAESKSARGVAFDRFEMLSGRPPPNACVEPPETVVASTSLIVGQRTVGPGKIVERPRKADAVRLYELGLALTHAVSERLQEARAPLLQALTLIQSMADAAPLRGRVLAALAIVAGRQGRTDEALEFVTRAERAVGATAALAKIRGDALAKVWRWQEAEVALTVAARAAPGNSEAWRALAIARGSLGRHAAALAAARTGLALSPRNADMLRVQALALRALGADPDIAEMALEAYDVHRPNDRMGDIKLSCAKSIPDCALERQPVHTHELR